MIGSVRPAGGWVLGTVFALGTVFLGGSLRPSAGQELPPPAERPELPSGLRMVQSVVPTSGPPGTRVDIYTENVSVQARIHLGVGAVGRGFEERGEATQQEFGEISGSLTIPSDTPNDRAVVIIVFNAIFAPVAISGPFHVTDGEGRLQRTGQVTAVTPDCVQLQDEDGFLYGLEGGGAWRTGERVVVVGRLGTEETCAGAATIHVERKERRGSSGPDHISRPDIP